MLAMKTKTPSLYPKMHNIKIDDIVIDNPRISWIPDTGSIKDQQQPIRWGKI